MSNLPSLGPRGEGWVGIQFVVFIVIAIAGLMAPGGWSGPVSQVVFAVGVALVAVGAALAISAILSLNAADALTAVPRPRDAASLVEHGAYRLVRHPIYGGLVLGATGWALARGSLTAFAGALLLFAFFDLKRRREEAWLVGRYPGYAAYRTRTRSIIPWLY